ncbi:MAG: hypothetical protein CMO81_02130 [Waddliaceae bacterium]|nr:hypothetical protein [Waddliaceae bacterium]
MTKYLPFIACFISLSLWGAQELNVLVQMTVPPLQNLELSQNSLNMPESKTEDFDRGYIDFPDALTLNISSNVPWKVLVHTEDLTLTNRNPPKPLADLLWKRSKRNRYRALRNKTRRVARSQNPVFDRKIDLDFRVLLDWVDDSPGNYQTTLIFTVAGNDVP